jgi:hypothetical protein
MAIERMIFGFFLSIALAASANATSVSGSRQSCIRTAMAAGSAALGNPAQLNRLYDRFFAGQNGPKVRGIVTGPRGQRSIITWHFVGPCKFVNVSIEGYGSLVGAVGKVSSKK